MYILYARNIYTLRDYHIYDNLARRPRAKKGPAHYRAGPLLFGIDGYSLLAAAVSRVLSSSIALRSAVNGVFSR